MSVSAGAVVWRLSLGSFAGYPGEYLPGGRRLLPGEQFPVLPGGNLDLPLHGQWLTPAGNRAGEYPVPG
jgi:hypothetical protein